MKFTLFQDRTHASLLGHSVEFKKGVPTLVPPALYAEVQAIGAVPEDELPAEEVSLTEPSDPSKRTEDILAALDMIATRNDRTDFGANGSPRIPAMAVILGWKPTSQERDALWARYQVDGVN